MDTGRRRGQKGGLRNTASVRASISFPPDIYETLEAIAAEKRVSLAWVVRDAAEKYISDKWPLLAAMKGGRRDT